MSALWRRRISMPFDAGRGQSGAFRAVKRGGYCCGLILVCASGGLFARYNDYSSLLYIPQRAVQVKPGTGKRVY